MRLPRWYELPPLLPRLLLIDSQTTNEEDEDFMAGLLQQVDSVNVPEERKRSDTRSLSTQPRKRAASPTLRRDSHKRQASVINADHSHNRSPVLTTKKLPFDDDHDERFDSIQVHQGIVGDSGSSDGNPQSSPPKPINSSRGSIFDKRQSDCKAGEEDENDLIVRAPVAFNGQVQKSINLRSMRPKVVVEADLKKEESVPPLLSSDAIDASSWMDISKTLNVVQSTTPANGTNRVNTSDCLEAVGTIMFYWVDYIEVNGILGLFGKVKDKSSGRYVSAYCRVDGIMRNLYFLPRGQKLCDANEDVSMVDVHAEVAKLMRDRKIEQFKAKSSNRKYAFEIPDIPEQSDYLKVLYSYKDAPFSIDLQGDTFSHVFGTNTAMFEQFVLHRRIMGPCWLELKNPDLKAAMNSTWCRLEVGVADPEHVNLVPDLSLAGLPEVPPMTLMSVAFRTIMNKKENKAEIVVISARIYHDMNIEDPRPAENLPCQTVTIARPIRNVFPNGFELEAKRQGLILERSETALLNAFLARWHGADPDLVVGHDWESVHFSTLLARLREKKISNWHRIGRIKRAEWPKVSGRGGFYAERSIAVGRLMCDLSNDLGRSVMTKAQSWSLTELCKLELNVSRQDIDSEKALQSWTETARGLLDFVMHCSMDTFYQTAIAIKVQIIPLSRQLTTLAGNSWAATLSGTRAQRNEYILLHEFTKNKFICPDKVWQKFKLSPDEDVDVEIPGKKKDKYKGGLVFEPEKGLYDKFILVMDFNSLYPSIIQEYNICFTTIERTNSATIDDEVVPDAPDRSIPQGILPKIIANLVNRRRQVKSLMKGKDATDVQKAQWDIRQQALKLTANSMYGCLGYTKSRFYARPLAVLTTFKGREALTNTKELADSQDLQVIYGDTDSVMINTNVDNYLDAIKIGNEFKRNVNERYRLLEIDIDNVFQRLLLHAKKKYAALVLYEVRGKLETKIEVKGLDMRRREYCTLSKEASQYCLDQILSGEQTELVVEKIHDYLREFATTMKDDGFPRHKFIILNRLGKEPETYPNAKSMPHVQVALRRKTKGDTIRVGDVMQYIITGGANDQGHVADRAYPASDVTKSGSELKIDYNYYLANQILPPLERLCAPIEGTDRTRIAECLGLDPNKYRIHELQDSVSSQITKYETTLSDEDRFAEALPLLLNCRDCRRQAPYKGLSLPASNVSSEGLKCSCGAVYSNISINSQLQSQIQGFITKYYQGWLLCDDSQCQTRTQQCGVYGRRCLSGTCRGSMRYEYSDSGLYNQLLYFDSLFDVDRMKKPSGGDEEVDRLSALAEHNRIRFETSRRVIASYLKKCGRRYVDMSSIFSFC